MEHSSFETYLIEPLVTFASGYLPVTMATVFLLGFSLRALIFLVVRSELNFAVEFEKRVHKYLTQLNRSQRFGSFYMALTHLLNQTYHETFELKSRYKRRNLDHVTTVTDRVFLIQEGTSRLMTDFLKQARYFRKDAASPKFVDVSKAVFQANPVFNRLFGLLPMGLINDLINLLPGLFIIGGIFGTFLGIIKGLPALGTMDVTDPVASKAVMDEFLNRISFAMTSSVMGIFYSVLMTVSNTAMAPQGVYSSVINKISGSLDFLWNETDTNEAPPELIDDSRPDRAAAPSGPNDFNKRSA